ncbi:unnamed protein product, partial [Larinioides sclopetarius]
VLCQSLRVSTLLCIRRLVSVFYIHLRYKIRSKTYHKWRGIFSKEEQHSLTLCQFHIKACLNAY